MKRLLLAAVVAVVGFVAACNNSTAPFQAHQDGGCPPGYLMSSGRQCVPGNLIPAVGVPITINASPFTNAPRPAVPFEAVKVHPFACGGCTTPEGKSGYIISAGHSCSPCNPN